MYENIERNEKKQTLIMLISIFIIATFIVGFVFGSSVMYSLASSKLNDIQYQMSLLDDNTKTAVTYNNTYNFNETSLSDIYKEVKDSIIVICGVAAYQTFWRTQYYEVQGSGFIYEFENQMVVITNNHVVADVSDIVVTFQMEMVIQLRL